jgi:hypothetical protein
MSCRLEKSQKEEILRIVSAIVGPPALYKGKNYGLSLQDINLRLSTSKSDGNPLSDNVIEDYHKGVIRLLKTAYSNIIKDYNAGNTKDKNTLKPIAQSLFNLFNTITNKNSCKDTIGQIEDFKAILAATTTNTGAATSPAPTAPSLPSSTTSNTSTSTGATQATSTAPQPTISQCANPYKDRWGVKFRYLDSKTGVTCGTSTNTTSTLKEWYLTLLPAMRSVMPNNGGQDVPGALPGLQFQIRSNIAKHKIPGFQPLYQHLGVDSIIITLIGTFTGDGGLGSTYDVSTKSSTSLGVSYTPWDSRTPVNPIWNEIVPTHNRAARGTVTLDANGNVVPLASSSYNATTGGGVNGGGIGINDSITNVSTGDPNVFMTKDLTRNGMWNRDGCPGDCEPYNKEYNAYSSKDGSITMNNPRQILNKDQDVFGAYTLRELAAYNDSYHEFISFYKMAIHEARELEIEINLRRNSDGLNPQVNSFLQYGRDAVGYLRNDAGNPYFKGVVKNMRVFHARSDRTWYSMEIEVTDYGMAGGQALNLTNRIEEQAKKAIVASVAAVNKSRAEAGSLGLKTFELSVDPECLRKFLKEKYNGQLPAYDYTEDKKFVYGKSYVLWLLEIGTEINLISEINNSRLTIKANSNQPSIVTTPLNTKGYFFDSKTGWGAKNEVILTPDSLILELLNYYKEAPNFLTKTKQDIINIVNNPNVIINSVNLDKVEKESGCPPANNKSPSSSEPSTHIPAWGDNTFEDYNETTPTESRPVTSATSNPETKPQDNKDKKDGSTSSITPEGLPMIAEGDGDYPPSERPLPYSNDIRKCIFNEFIKDSGWIDSRTRPLYPIGALLREGLEMDKGYLDYVIRTLDKFPPSEYNLVKNVIGNGSLTIVLNGEDISKGVLMELQKIHDLKDTNNEESERLKNSLVNYISNPSIVVRTREYEKWLSNCS